MEVLKITFAFLIIISGLIFSEAICNTGCVNDSVKITKVKNFGVEKTFIDTSGDYMVVGIRGKQRILNYHYYYYGYPLVSYYTYEHYAIVTIYEYKNNSWMPTFKLPNVSSLSAVAIDGNHMAMLSSNGTGSRMSITVFTRARDTWVNHTVLPLAHNKEYCCLEIQSGSLIAIGGLRKYYSYDYDYNASIYVYTNDSWDLTEKWNLSDCHNHPVVAMYHSLIIIGCPDYNSSIGIVYVFKHGVKQATILPPHGEWLYKFGLDVAIDGDILVVSGLIYYSGTVLIYKLVNDNWIEEARLQARNKFAGYFFGSSVSLSGRYLVVGDREHHENTFLAGAAFLYKYINGVWIEQVKLISSDSHMYQMFGAKVAISGNQIFVGTGEQYCYNCTNVVYIYQNILYTQWYTESTKISKSGFYNRSIMVGMSRDYMVIGIYNKINARFRYYPYYYYYHYYYYYYYYYLWRYKRIRNYVDVTIYKNIYNTWTPGFEPIWRLENVTAIDLDNNYLATLTFNNLPGSSSITIFTQVNNMWVNNTFLPLPNDTMYNSLEIQNDTLVTIGMPLYYFRNISMYVYKNVAESWKLYFNISLYYHCMEGVVIAMDGHFIIIGCPTYNYNSGIAYIFKFDGDKLISTPSTPAIIPEIQQLLWRCFVN